MILTREQLKEIFGGLCITDHSLFGVNTVIMIEGFSWELVEIIKDEYIFELSDDVGLAELTVNFFLTELNNSA